MAGFNTEARWLVINDRGNGVSMMVLSVGLRYCPACDCDRWRYRHSRDEYCRRFENTVKG